MCMQHEGMFHQVSRTQKAGGGEKISLLACKTSRSNRLPTVPPPTESCCVVMTPDQARIELHRYTYTVALPPQFGVSLLPEQLRT